MNLDFLADEFFAGGDRGSDCENQSQGFQHFIEQACKNASNNASRCPGAPAVEEAGFWTRHMWLFIMVAIVLLLLIISRVFHVRWQQTSKQRQESGETSEKNQALVKQLVLHFVPNYAVANYQFRGMKKNTTGISVEFNDLGLKLKSGKAILAGATGSFEAGRMVAVMGPSGCGKSTFLNVLCGKATYGTMTGEVKINGKQGNLHELMPITGFVPQDDVVHERLTVREQIRYSAELRNAVGTGRAQLQAIVEDTLNVLQVLHIQRSIVGGVEERGISGGQRKRVNIGLELAACPSLLFLDEPTSGLDSTSSLMIIDSLKKMTELNMTIIMVIHQPRYSLFQLFDQVLLLGVGGLTCYLGPAQDAVTYFESLGFQLPVNDNPADWLMDVLSGAAQNISSPEFKATDLVESWKTLGEAWRAGKGKELAAQIVDLDDMASNQKVQTKDLDDTADPDRFVARTVHDLVQEEWIKIDHDGNRIMSSSELKAFLQGCLHEEVSDDSVVHIMNLIATSTGVAAEVVGKNELESFLCAEAKKLRGLTSGQVLTEQGTSMVEKLEDTCDHAEIALEDVRVKVLAEKNGGAMVAQRRTPGIFQQFRVELHRRMVQWWRQIQRRCMDMGMIVLCAVIMAGMSLGNTQSLSNIIFMHLGLALLTTVSALKTFSDRAIFWRESARGLNTFAFFCGRTIADLFDVLNQTVAYVAIFYLITQPPVAFQHYFIPSLCAAFAAGGWGYLVSALLPPENAAVSGVILMLILGGAFGEPEILLENLGTGGLLEIVVGAGPTRWSMQMFFLKFHEEMGDLRAAPTMPDCPSDQSKMMGVSEAYLGEAGEYKMASQMRDTFESTAVVKFMGNMGSGIFVLVLQGVILRMMGFLCLKYTNRDKKV